MATKRCPYCAEEIQQEAIKCKHCASWLGTAQTDAPGWMQPGALPARRLTRSVSDRLFWGVCGGMGRYLGIDPTLIRIAYAFMTIFTAFFPGVLLYILLVLIIPLELPE